MKPRKLYYCHIAEDVIKANLYNKKALSMLDYIKKAFPDSFHSAEDSDVIIVLGGDGTMLKAIHHYYYKNLATEDKIFFGFGFGTANFLMNDWNEKDGVGNVQKMLLDYCKPPVPVEIAKVRTMLVSVDVADTFKQKPVDLLVVNDVVIGGDLMSWQKFEVSDEENVFGSFNGTGLIVSTAVGSTGYNKNNGGVVLPLLSSNISVTGMGTSRRIQEVIHSQDMKVSFNSRSDVYIWIDGNGQKLGPFREGTVTIKPGPWLNLGFFNTHDYQIKRRQ